MGAYTNQRTLTERENLCTIDLLDKLECFAKSLKYLAQNSYAKMVGKGGPLYRVYPLRQFSLLCLNALDAET